MDSCHIFNLLFGTRKATSELRKCFSGGQQGGRGRAARKPPGKQNGGHPSSQAPRDASKQQPKSAEAGAPPASPLKQIQLKLVNFAVGCSESSVFSGPKAQAAHRDQAALRPQQECPTASASRAATVVPGEGLEGPRAAAGLPCGIYEAQLVRLDDEGAGLVVERHTGRPDAADSDDGAVVRGREPFKVIVENPANKLDERTTRDSPGNVSQQKINLYDNPLVRRNGPPPNDAGREPAARTDRTKLSEQTSIDKRDERSERVRNLVQSFELARQPPEQPASPATLARRPSKPPDTPPKSNRARCFHLQVSLRKPTSVASLFQDEIFLAHHFFTKLAPIDRCAAAQVCRRWRNILYANKDYWKDLVTVIDCTQLRREHLANCILNTLQTARLKHQLHVQQRLQQQQNLNGPANNHAHGSPAQHNQHQDPHAAYAAYGAADLGQLDQNEVWRIQELCNRYTMRGAGINTGPSSHTVNGQALTNRTSSASQPDQNDATTTSGIANSKSSSSQISSSTLSSISISSLLSPLSESSRVDSIREKLYTALDERGFDSVCLFGATDDDIDDLVSKTRPNGAQVQIKLGRLSNCSISDRGLETFVANFGLIEELELTGCNEITNAFDLRGLRHLRRLTITDCINIADGLAARLAEVLHQLEVLVVQAYHLTDAFLEYLSLNADTSRLKRLELPNCKEISNASALTVAKHFQALDTLSVSGSTKIGDDGIELLCEHLDTLSCLDLGWLKIGDLSLECLACDLRHLRELVLDRNVHITDLGVGYLATMADLTLLYVRWCPQLTDKSIKSISNMRALTRLSLAGLHQITARGILSLLDSPQLEELELTNCPAVTLELQQFLSAKMPNCNIIY